MIKSLKRNDIRYTPFVANKSWNAQNQRFEDLISWQSGSESGSLLLTFFDYGDGTKMSEVSSAFSSAIAYQQQDPDFVRFKIGKEITGSTFYTVDSKYYNSDTNPVNIDDSYQRLVYNTVKNLYYKESENPTQIFGLESLDTSVVNRSLPSQISVFSVPQNKFGEKIVPYSVKVNQKLEDCHVTAIDDGNTNLVISGSTFVDRQNANFNCVSASVNHTNLTQTYNGSQKLVSVTTVPYNLVTSTTYNGSSTPPTDAGTYTVFSEIVDGFYCGNKIDTFTVNKAPATITITPASVTYDGTPKTLSVTTTPSGLNYALTYAKDGLYNVESAISVGKYKVTATIVDSNYYGQSVATLDIIEAVSIISFDSISNIVYGDFGSRQLNAVDTVNKLGIIYTIISGATLAQINGNQLNIVPSKNATTLGSVTIQANIIPTKGFTATPVTKTFSITPKPVTINGITAQSIFEGDTSVPLKGTPILDGLVSADIPFVSISTPPTIGTKGSAVNITTKTYNVTPSVPYSITGTNSNKYTLTQPTITVQVGNSVVANDVVKTYDTNPYYVGNGIEDTIRNSFNLGDTYYISYGPSTSDVLMVSYNNKTNYIPTLYRTDKYTKTNDGSLLNPNTNTDIWYSKQGFGMSNRPISATDGYPINVGLYNIYVSNKHPLDISTDTSAVVTKPYLKTFTLRIDAAVPVFGLENTTQTPPIQTIVYNENDNNRNFKRVKPLSEEIKDVNVTSLTITDRYNNKIDLLKKFNITPSVTYKGLSSKPTTPGNYFVIPNYVNNNLMAYTEQSLKIGNFIYVFTNTYSNSDIVSSTSYTDFTSSAFNLRKYYDPSVTGSWSDVISSYSDLKNYVANGSETIEPSFQIVGGGGPYSQPEPFEISEVISVTNLNSSQFKSTIKTKIDSSNYTSMMKTLAKAIIDAIPTTNCQLPSTWESGKYTLIWTPNVPKTDNCTNVRFSGDYDVTIFDTTLNYSADFYLDIDMITGNPNQYEEAQSVLYSFKGSGYGYRGGSGAYVGFRLPINYVVKNNLQSIKAHVGKVGEIGVNREVSSYILGTPGYPNQGQGDKMAAGNLLKLYNLPPIATFVNNAPILKNFKFSATYNNGSPLPTNDLIFVGKDVTQSQLDNFAIITSLSDIVKVQAGDKLDITSNAVVNDFLSIGYYIWKDSVVQNYQVIVYENYQASNRQVSNLSKTFIIPSSFKSTDILVIGFSDVADPALASPFPRPNYDIYGLQDFTVKIKVSTTGYPNGGNSYLLTGSLSDSQYALLGIIAGGARDRNAGTSSVNYTSYTGKLYTDNNSFTTEVKNYGGLNENASLLNPFYNTAIDGQSSTEGGKSVIPGLTSQTPYGKYGVSGNYSISGVGLYRIFANSSSVYDPSYIT